LASRLARYADDGAPALGAVPLKDLPLAVVRERILLAGNGDRVFAGTLRASLSGMTDASDETVLAALHAASSEDIVDALDEGLDTTVEEKGRNFSGGQLQRLRLARALVADPEFLLAVEATSAVDAHTEARIAERIGGYRAQRPGPRTTVLFTTSPLVLDHADEVAYVEAGRVVESGSDDGSDEVTENGREDGSGDGSESGRDDRSDSERGDRSEEPGDDRSDGKNVNQAEDASEYEGAVRS
jgi:ABC-type multidrug transport system fused ATPase/permease subunit